MKPVNWTADRKGSFIITFIEILFLFQQVCPKKGWKGITLRTSPYDHKKAVVFPGENILGMFNVACNFGHVFPCLVIRGMIMLMLLT